MNQHVSQNVLNPINKAGDRMIFAKKIAKKIQSLKLPYAGGIIQVSVDFDLYPGLDDIDT